MALLTNGEHDNLWRGAFEKIPTMSYSLETISDSFRRANGLTIIKELYGLGGISKEQYMKALEEILGKEGFQFN